MARLVPAIGLTLVLGSLLLPLGGAHLALLAVPQPVLTDPEGNVQYDAAYPGPHDHTYLDLTAVTVFYDETRDVVTVSLMTPSFVSFQSRTAESSLDYRVWGHFGLGDKAAGGFQFNYTTSLHDVMLPPSERSADASFCRDTGFLDCLPAKDVVFTLEESRPGWMNWTVPRASLLWHGDWMGDFQSATIESYSPHAWFNVPVRATNPVASSTDRFDVASLRPASSLAAPDPLDQAAQDPVTASAEGAEHGSPGIGVASILVGVVVAAVAARGRRMP